MKRYRMHYIISKGRYKISQAIEVFEGTESELRNRIEDLKSERCFGFEIEEIE